MYKRQDMDRQPPAVEVIRLVAEQIEKLTIHEGGHKIEGAVPVSYTHLDVYKRQGGGVYVA